MTTDEARQAELLDQVFHGKLPPCLAQPCNECPWVRTSTPGHTGPFTGREWAESAHSDTPIMCHKTLRGIHDFTDPEIRQCRGAAIFRANVHKVPRNPTAVTGPRDTDLVFASGAEMADHHDS